MKETISKIIMLFFCELLQFILLSMHFDLSCFACHLFQRPFYVPYSTRTVHCVCWYTQCNSHFVVALAKNADKKQVKSTSSKEPRVAMDAEAEFHSLNGLVKTVSKTNENDERSI